MLEYRIIDLNTYPHRAHLEYFMSMQSPHLCITAEVDVTDLKAFCKREKCSFFLAFLHVVALSADSVPVFRQRLHLLSEEERKLPEHSGAPTEGYLKDLEIREYAESPTSHTESCPNDLYCYCTLSHHVPWEEYIVKATEAQMRARNNASLDEDDEIEGFYFASSIPWINYTEVVHPMVDRYDSNPKFGWGKFKEDFRGRLMMPVTVAAHHGLIDGIMLGRFYDNLDKNMAALVEGKLEY